MHCSCFWAVFGLSWCTGADQRLLQRADLVTQTSSIRLTLTDSLARVEEHRRWVARFRNQGRIAGWVELAELRGKDHFVAGLFTQRRKDCLQRAAVALPESVNVVSM
jgi:adenosylmethionine-8-amino-7-oxononanoate aminotransferase